LNPEPKPAAHILIVDDDESIRTFLRGVLKLNAYQVSEADGGQAALRSAAAEQPQLIILDLGLPDLDGIEVTRRLREITAAPIIILSVREQESDKIDALDAGADDYLTKPFGSGELLARIRTALRRSGQNGAAARVQSGALVIDFTQRLVSLDGAAVELNPTEYDLLGCLARSPGRVLTHKQLLSAVWGEAYQFNTHLLRQNISTLRQKIERDPARPRYILTEAGIGYRFNPAAG
jgi:two-component system KDP operon response regulator KdpE